MHKGLICCAKGACDLIYPQAERTVISRLVDLVAPPVTAQEVLANPVLLREVEVIFSGWGAPCFTEDLLAQAPNLKAVFYGAGSVRSMVTPAFWERGILLTNAVYGNAIPVAEYAFAHIILGLKSTWQHVQAVRQDGHRHQRLPMAGANGSTVGLISLGTIGRLVMEHLRRLDVNILAFDPFASPMEGFTLCSLEEVFSRSNVVSLHTPWLKETEGMITGAMLDSMPPYSTFINTARGAVVREDEMIAVLQHRPDLVAVLDVTYPEPPVPDSPLLTMPNVILTPHIAGAVCPGEARRMGQMMIEEYRRYASGMPLKYALTRQQAERMA
ncbi:MAG TPA: hydroxyacid dehydrogenase [Anaerolineaceae bacterium]